MDRLKTILALTLSLLTLFYLFGCVKKENVNSIETMTSSKATNLVAVKAEEQIEHPIPTPQYGEHTEEIEKFLSATPLGAEIYLEQKEGGEWYLKVEKTFTAKKDEEARENLEPIYGESILI